MLATSFRRLILACVTLLALAAPPALAQLAYGVDGANNLVTFNVATPGTIASTTAVTGLAGGETVLGIDFRPATGQLYALGSGSRLYTINTATGAATQVGSDGAFTLSGTAFGFDVNPVPDRIRVVSDTGQNIRLNPITGTLAATDATLNGAATGAVGSAYTNSFAGATVTTLFALDSASDSLLIQNPPNNGTLTLVGATGVNFSASAGFDILTTGSVNTGYAALQVAGSSGLYTIDLTTGAATLVGAIGSGAQIAAFAIGKAGTAPTITSANTTSFADTVAGTFTPTATGPPAPLSTVTGTLPAGVTLNTLTGVLSGTPGLGTAGTYPLVVTASNGVAPNATQNFSLVVTVAGVAPSITSAANANFVVGTPGTFNVTATGVPLPTLSLAGTLPAGITFIAATGVLSGTPSAGSQGTYPVVITAANGVLPNAVQNLSIVVTAGATAVVPVPALSPALLLVLSALLGVLGLARRRQ